jgi:hypothetical protein
MGNSEQRPRYLPVDLYRILLVASSERGGAFQYARGGYAADQAMVRHAETHFWVRCDTPREVGFPHERFIVRFKATPAGRRKLEEVRYVL